MAPIRSLRDNVELYQEFLFFTKFTDLLNWNDLHSISVLVALPMYLAICQRFNNDGFYLSHICER